MAVLFVLSARSASAQLDAPVSGLWSPNGSVYAVVVTGTRAYVGGSFSQIGPAVGYGFPADRSTGDLQAVFPKVTGEVRAAISDGSGGWYIGGDFTKVGALSTQRLAHIKSDGTVDTAFVNTINNSVRALLLRGGKLYVGGDFTSVNGYVRNRLVALDPATAAVDTVWNPGANSTVYALSATGTTIYVGGAFSNLGSNARNYLGAVNDNDGTATAWDPSANDVVETMLISPDGAVLYAGGAFTTLGPDTRNHLAAVDLATASATAWNPNADSNIKTMARSGSVLYVGGNFTNIGGDTRNYVAAVDLATASATAWNPNADSTVNSILAYGSVVHVGGDFTAVGGATRYYVAALDSTTGSSTAAWAEKLDNSTNVLALDSGASKIYVGGRFITYGGVLRNYLAEIDLTTKQPTSWDPSPDNPVRAIDLSPDGSKMYIGGDFTNVGATGRQYLASFNRATGALDAWDPSADATVYALAVATSGLVYAGGNFSAIGVAARPNLAAIDPVTGVATAWDVSGDPPPNPVRSIKLKTDDGVLYMSGAYTNCTFPPLVCTYRGNVSAYQTSDGTKLWNTRANNHVNAIALSADGTRIFAGGQFTTFDGFPGNRLMAASTADGLRDVSFDFAPDSTVSSLAVDPLGQYLYVGGVFTSIGGTSRNRLAAIDLSANTLSAWNPDSDGNISAIAGDRTFSQVMVGGDHLALGGSLYPYISLFQVPTIQFAYSSWNDGESAGTVNIGMTLSQASPLDATAEFVFSGTATDGSDYSAPIRATIPAGSTSANATVTVTDDAASESDESVVLTMARAYRADVGSRTSFTLTIRDNDGGGGSGGGGGGSGGGGGGSDLGVTVIPAHGYATPGYSIDPSLVEAMRALGYNPHDLVKLADDGNPATQDDSTVYYLGIDGRRHAFPNSSVYFSWYCSFAGVRVISSGDLAKIPLGRNAAYRPGLRLVKFPSIPTVYLAQTGGVLRPIPDEVTAHQLLGAGWNKLVTDISEAFYNDYVINGPIVSPFNLRQLGQSPSTISGNLNFDGYTESPLTEIPACQVQATEPQTASAPAAAEAPVWPYSGIPRDFSFANDLNQTSGSSAEIKYLQQVLASLDGIYPEGLVTGVYGTATVSAVRRFQVQQGLSSVGVVGPATRAALNGMLDKYR